MLQFVEHEAFSIVLESLQYNRFTAAMDIIKAENYCNFLHKQAVCEYPEGSGFIVDEVYMKDGNLVAAAKEKSK